MMLEGWFLLFWLSTPTPSAWEDEARAHLIGPIDRDACKTVERELNRWKTDVFAKCFELRQQ